MMSFKNEHFELNIFPLADSTKIRMEVLGDILTTKDIPHTYKLLSLHLPSIFRSKCFNENNYPFVREVKKTEIGHLFEHILLEYLSVVKRNAGYTNTIHNGLTTWNWQEERCGVFHIDIDICGQESGLLRLALQNTISLTTKIMEHGYERSQDIVVRPTAAADVITS